MIKEELASAINNEQALPYNMRTDLWGKDLVNHFEINKEEYRPLIIAWADALGWSDGTKLRERLFNFEYNVWGRSVCIDNIRYPDQADIAREFGFKIVRLLGGEYVDHYSERAMDDYHIDLVVPFIPVEERAKFILENI